MLVAQMKNKRASNKGAILWKGLRRDIVVFDFGLDTQKPRAGIRAGI